MMSKKSIKNTDWREWAKDSEWQKYAKDQGITPEAYCYLFKKHFHLDQEGTVKDGWGVITWDDAMEAIRIDRKVQSRKRLEKMGVTVFDEIPEPPEALPPITRKEGQQPKSPSVKPYKKLVKAKITKTKEDRGGL